MSKINEILSVEESNDSNIYLYKEGAFWKAYQQSAYLLLKHCNVDYIVKHKYVKYVSTTVFYIGFPQSALRTLFKDDKLEYPDEGRIQISITDKIDVEDYKRWINGNAGKTSFTVKKSIIQNDNAFIIRKLQEFDISSSTPVDCLMFVAEMQKLLKS